MSESANGTSDPARSTTSRSAGGYGRSAVARMRTFGRGPGSISIAARLMPSPEVPDIIPTEITRRLSCEGSRHRFVDRDAEAIRLLVVPATEVDAVREEDDGQVELRIDPQRCAGETGVPVGVDAEVGTDHRPVRRAKREADAAPHVALLHALRPCGNREVVADDRAVAEHPRDGRDVRRRTEEPGVSTDTTDGR